MIVLEFSANLSELKRERPNDFGYMLSKYICQLINGCKCKRILSKNKTY